MCLDCKNTDRVPDDRPALAARCGPCDQQLFEERPIAADEATFEKHGSSGDIPLLVDVWVPWGVPCQTLAPALERAASLSEPEVCLLKLNSDAVPGLASRLGLRRTPVLFLIQWTAS
ncbi:thioredoxin domain-containing protein [Methylobacterium sp. P31]